MNIQSSNRTFWSISDAQTKAKDQVQEKENHGIHAPQALTMLPLPQVKFP